MGAWHEKRPGAVLHELGTDRRGGLSAEEAERRLREYGPNRLREGKRRSGFGFLLITGLVCLAITAVFLVLYYQMPA